MQKIFAMVPGHSCFLVSLCKLGLGRQQSVAIKPKILKYSAAFLSYVMMISSNGNIIHR